MRSAYQARLFLRDAADSGLDSVSLDNLRCGRITRQFIKWIMSRHKKHIDLKGWGPPLDLCIADAVNDYLDAGRAFPLHAGELEGAKR